VRGRNRALRLLNPREFVQNFDAVLKTAQSLHGKDFCSAADGHIFDGAADPLRRIGAYSHGIKSTVVVLNML
jgi:hypothetical protein